MASIVARKRNDGSMAYTAQIRIKREGAVVFSESKTFNKRASALAWANEREDQIKRDPATMTRANHQGVTVGNLIERYLSDRAGTDPLGRTKLAHLSMMLGFEIASRDAVDLTTQQVVDHVRMRRRSGTGPSTVGNDIIWLRVVMRYARTAMGILVPAQVLDDAAEICKHERLTAKSNRRKRRPTDDELTRISAWFNAPKTAARKGPPMYLFLWFSIYSCRRLSESCALRLGDFDREHMTWLVRDVKNPGGSKGNHREMTVPERLLPVIDAIIKEVPRADDRLLPFNPRTVGTAWQRAMKLIGIDDLHFHDLRREGCSRLAEDGLTIPGIQQVSLHENWGSLQIYVNTKKRKTVRVEYSDGQ